MTAERPGVTVESYLLDHHESRFTVRAFAGGMLSSLGHNPTIAIRDFTGEAEFDPAVPEKASLRLRIRADSLEVTDDISSKDRREMETTMNGDVLESSKYPEIVYESTGSSASEKVGEGRYKITLDGRLLLHGVTRPQPVTARVSVVGDGLRASGEFSVLQSDYRITLVKVAGGALRLKDELKLTFDILARRKG